MENFAKICESSPADVEWDSVIRLAVHYLSLGDACLDLTPYGTDLELRKRCQRLVFFTSVMSTCAEPA